MTLLTFYACAVLAVASALAMVLNVRNTVASAMSLVVTMIALAVIFVLLEAHLIAVIQIMVYAGAIVVLFVFVVMLLNLQARAFAPARQLGSKVLGALLGAAVLVWLLRAVPGLVREPVATAEGFGGYREVARTLFTDYVLPFETVAFLLLAAMVGAVVLAKRRID